MTLVELHNELFKLIDCGFIDIRTKYYNRAYIQVDFHIRDEEGNHVACELPNTLWIKEEEYLNFFMKISRTIAMVENGLVDDQETLNMALAKDYGQIESYELEVA